MSEHTVRLCTRVLSTAAIGKNSIRRRPTPELVRAYLSRCPQSAATSFSTGGFLRSGRSHRYLQTLPSTPLLQHRSLSTQSLAVRKKGIGKKKGSSKSKKLKNTHHGGNFESHHHNSDKMRNKKKKKRPFPAPPTVGPTGRPILTDALAHERPDIYLDPFGGTSHTQNSKNYLHNAKHQLLFQPHLHIEEGPGGAFIATYTLTWDDAGTVADLQSLTDKNYVDSAHLVHNPDADTWKLVAMGMARNKKAAERLAAHDMMVLLLQELGIHARTPPNLEALYQERVRAQQKEQLEHAKRALKAQVARANCLLELLGVSRPRMMHQQEQDPDQQNRTTWRATVTTFCRGTSVSATGQQLGSNKAESEKYALLALVEELTKDARLQGQLEHFQALMDAAPAQHVAALRVPPLADDILEEQLGASMGSPRDHAMRMSRHALAKESYEQSLQDHDNKTYHRDRFAPRVRSARQLASINRALFQEEQERLKKAINDPEGKQGVMKAIRDALPIRNIQNDLIRVLKSEQVVVVSGGTGSGKSTQCPQYILEDAINHGHGAHTKILVTQPRKIAAISVAERVAAERDERIGNSIGYSVRFQRQAPRDVGGTVEFVTTGVLLRRILNDPTLEGITHVMIDEVHERDINTDFLLILLRDLLPKRPDLRVVLMSATLDAESFGKYFSRDRDAEVPPVPLLSVPTQPRHPVAVSFLEDLASSSDNSSSREYRLPPDVQQLAQTLLEYNDANLRTELEEAIEEEKASDQLELLARKEDDGELSDSDSDSSGDSDSESDSDSDDEDDNRSRIAKNRLDALRRAVSMRGGDIASPKPFSSKTRFKNRGEAKFDAGDAIVSLSVKLAQHLSQIETDAGRSGSILCFLPGWDEIKEATAELESTTNSALLKKIKILPLHSTIPQGDQQRVFEPANGSVKVILSTNIAESSVTIDDVLAVVDSGLVRELNFDPESAMSAMETNQTSRASATQRLGRAGRVAPGRCYRLYSRGDFEAMAERPTPEIQRTALEATCLQTCSMTTDGVETFLSRAMDPPAEDAVAYAMDRLIKLGAINKLDHREALTPLGRCLSRFPLDPATGRMLIMGVVTKCLDPLLTSAACFSSRNTFYNPPGLRNEAHQVRRDFCDTSDIMGMVRAYYEFWSIVEEEGWHEAKRWAQSKFVSISAMTSIKAVRSQLLQELNKAGLVVNSDLERMGRQNTALRSDATVNLNADVEMLWSAIWATAFPNNLAARRQLGSFGTLRTRLDGHAGLHPSSVGFHRKPPARGSDKLPSWYLYREMVLSSQLFLRGCTAMSPEQILLFGGYSMKRINTHGQFLGNDGDDEDYDDYSDDEIKANNFYEDAEYDSDDEFDEGDPRKDFLTSLSGPSRARGVLDDWIVVEGSCAESMDLLLNARDELNAALEFKVMYPRSAFSDETQLILDDIACMFETLDPSKEKQGEGDAW